MSRATCLVTGVLPGAPAIHGALRRPRGKPEFDYAAFPDAVQRNLRETAAAIRTRLDIRRRIGSAVDAVQVGLWLHDVHRCLGRTYFQPFLCAEWSKAGANRFMRAATHFQHVDPDCLDRFEATALYILSRKYVRQSARDEAIARARAGKCVKSSDARRIIYRQMGLSVAAVAFLGVERALKKAFKTAGSRPDATTLEIIERISGRIIKGASKLRRKE
jgi:hypothetical protein